MGADIIKFNINRIEDSRGFFSELISAKNLELCDNFKIAQINYVYNKLKGTIRGLHYAIDPEGKIITPISGRIQDIVVDIRKKSPKFGLHYSFNLEPGQALYVPKGYAHGYQTLDDDTTVLYCVDKAFNSETGREVNFNDPDLNIDWQLPLSNASPKDLNAQNLKDIIELL